MKGLGNLLLCSIVLLGTNAAHAQDQRFASLGDFKLESGEILRGCRIGYRTIGNLNRERSNVLLVPTWAGGTTAQWLPSVGRGQLADTSKYYVILVDALSNGVSSSPSNSRRQPRMQFPKITIRDMVDSQHELLAKILDIPHVKAVMGISMGGMQTFEWMVAYPGFMDKAIPIVGSPRLDAYDLVHWQAQIDAIENNAAWQGGNYTKNPARDLEYEFGAILLTTPERFNQTHSRALALQALAHAKVSQEGSDANDKIRQTEAMMALNVARRFGDSLAKAAAAVKVPVLVIVNKQDHTVTPGPAMEFARLVHAELLELDDDCGHQYNACDDERVRTAVAEFLRR